MDRMKQDDENCECPLCELRRVDSNTAEIAALMLAVTDWQLQVGAKTQRLAAIFLAIASVLTSQMTLSPTQLEKAADDELDGIAKASIWIYENYGSSLSSVVEQAKSGEKFVPEDNVVEEWRNTK